MTTPPRTRGAVEVTVVNPDGSQAVAPMSYFYMAPPTIISLTPSRGPASGGTLVTIEGSEFLEDPDGEYPTILFCDSYEDGAGCSAAEPGDVDVTVNGRTIKVLTPPHSPSLVDVAVVAPDGQADWVPNTFTFSELPAITSVEPDSGPTLGGATVTIFGSAFQPGVRALFDGKDCEDIVIQGADGLSCTTPPGTTGPADVVILNPDGGTFELPDGYTYLPPPVISDLSPTSATEEEVASPGVEVTITGVNFSPSARVFFDAAEAIVNSASFNTITAQVPQLVGSVDVIVRNPDGQEARVVDGFAYIPPQASPTVLFITPRVGLTYGAELFRVTGANFRDGVTVEFGLDDTWALATDIAVEPDGGVITGLTPVHEAGVVDVRITNDDGQYIIVEDGYEYVLPPEDQPLSIINVDPSRSIVSGGAWITVAGTGFQTDISLKFNQDNVTVPALAIQRFGPTLMRAKVPPAPVGAGPAILVVTNPATGDSPALTVEVADFFEYIDGPVFERHPGDRLPNEDDTWGSDGALVFDANGDGLNDVLVYKYNGWDKLLINGFGGRPGWFSRQTFREDPTSNHRTQTAHAVDIDSDGDLDVMRVIDTPWGDRLEQCRNDGGVFSCWTIWDPNNGNCDVRDINIADMNCDGKEDIYYATSRTSSCGDHIVLNLGEGQWAATRAPLPARMENTRGTAVADVDGDGDYDILMSQDASTQTRLLLNNCADLQLEQAGGCTLAIPDFDTASYNGKLYAFSNYTDDWHDARDYCRSWGYDLVSINDPEEDEFVRYAGIGRGHEMWIGLRDTDDNNRDEWVDGSGEMPPEPYVTDPDDPQYFHQKYCSLSGSGSNPDYTPNANPSEPNSTSYDCTRYSWDSSSCCGNRRSCWDDIYCSYGYRFMCESQGTKPPCNNDWLFIDVQYNTTFPLHGADSLDALLFDINDDGLVDAFVANRDRASRVFMNTGTATAGGELFLDDTPTRWPAENPAPRLMDVKAVDLDADGDLDIFGIAQVLNSSNNFDHWAVRTYFNDRYVKRYVQPGCDYEIEDCACHPKVESCEEVVLEGVGIFSELTSERWGPYGDPDDIRTNASSLLEPHGIGDLDDDGLPDIYIAGYTRSDRMVMNDGFEEGLPWVDENRVGIGHFRFNTYRAMPELPHDTDGLEFADVTGDFVPDIVMCGYNEVLRLWVNTGQGNYIDVTDTAIPEVYRYRCREHSVGIGDIDGDGDNDIIFVGTDSYSSCPSGIDCHGAVQLVNDGTGHFHDTTNPNFTSGHSSYGGEGVTILDLDDDGDNDWLVGYNYSSYDSRVYINAGDAYNVGGALGMLRGEWLNPTEAMGFDPDTMTKVNPDNIREFIIIDVNHDRFPDVFVSTTGGNRAWLNVDGKFFVNATSDTVPPGPFISAGSTDTRDLVEADYDNDGDLDIIDLVNGKNRYMVRSGGNGFVDITNDTMPDTSRNSIGGDAGDLDQDGYLDVVVANWEQQNELLLNLGGSGFQDLSANLPYDRHRSRQPFLFDFDGDGDLDVYFPSEWDQHRIYVNTVVTP